MRYIIKGHNFEHEIQVIGQIFYKNQGFCRADNIPFEGICVLSCLDKDVIKSGLYVDGCEIALRFDKVECDELSFAVKDSMFRLLKSATGINPPWGSLTGIRPTKIMRGLIDSGLKYDEAIRFMRGKYTVLAQKAELLAEIVDIQREILKNQSENDASLYIGIPFCPTRCHYCSFAAYPIDKFKKHTDAYVNALINEMRQAELLGKSIKTVYIGGGTPTALNDNQLERVLDYTANSFDLKNVSEYSVEAGRPDTITKSNLKLLKKYGISRISINTQTLKDDTLKQIGREHTAQQFFDAYNLAREVGFDFINVDLIAGLPGESVLDFNNSLEKICALSPENLTVHTLAVKRASKFREDIIDSGSVFESKEAGEMINIAYERAKNADLNPYYLYRQKNTVGSFENVGYAKKGRECIYNIHIMEETATIFAFGAGAITKYVYLSTGGPSESRIERSANVKDVLEYIKRNPC